MAASFFVVRITDVSAAPSYQWVEVWDQGAGTLVDLVGGRYGGAENPGVDVLGIGFEEDGYALCRQADGRGGLAWELYPLSAGELTVEKVGGTPSYSPVTKLVIGNNLTLSQPAAGSARIDATGGSGNKAVPCKWLQGVLTTACWTAYRRGGRGKCECWATDDINSLTAGGVAIYVASLSGWLVTKLNSGDWPMVKSCCGCGSLLFKIDGTTFEPTLTLGGVHSSCADGTVYTKVLTDYVCYELPDGRRVVEFFGFDSDAACDSETDDPCANEYRIALVCGAECPPAGCGCGGCGASPTPVAWYKLGVVGFPSASGWNGDWVWRPTAACVWTAVCGENTSTLEYLAGDDPVWRLTHGGSVYAEFPDDGQCTVGMTLIRTSGSDSPASIALTPVQGAGDAPTCCGGCNIEDLKEKTLYLSIAGVPEVLSATYDDANDWWYFSGVVTGCTCMGGLFEAYLECLDGQLLFSLIALCPCKGSAKCVFGAMSPGDQFLAVESCEPFFASGEQYLRLSCLTNPTMTTEFTLSEVAP